MLDALEDALREGRTHKDESQQGLIIYTFSTAESFVVLLSEWPSPKTPVPSAPP